MPTPAQHDGWPLGAQIAARVLALYVERFGSLEPLLQDVGAPGATLDRSAAAFRDAPPQLLNKICSRAVDRLAAPEKLALSRGRLGRSDWRVILYCLTGASTLRDAIRRCVDCFEALEGRCGLLALRMRADMAELHLASGASRPYREGVIDLYGVAEIHRLLSALIGQPLPLRRICLDAPDPWLSTLDLSELPCSVETAAEWTGFEIPAAYLDHPVICGMDELTAIAQQSFLFRAESPTEGAQASADVVRRFALRTLRDKGRLPKFEALAQASGTSEATLRRRLAEEGTTYREIRESCRRELGLQLLRRPGLSIEEISARLDYCDADAFRRAFHGWFGAPPSRFRRTALARTD